MDIHFSILDFLVVGLYLGLVAFLGFHVKKKNSTLEYVLAGRNLTLPVFVMTLVSTWYGGILGVAEFTYSYGVSSWVVQGFPYYIFAALFAYLFAGKIRGSELKTIPERIEQHYGKAASVAASVMVLILVSPAPYILMIGNILQLLTHWPFFWCMFLGTVFSSVYLYHGGFEADVQTDILEFIFMFVGFAVMLLFCYVELGGKEYIVANVPTTHTTLLGENKPQWMIVWFLIALWTFVDPSFHQRCYAAKDAKVARRGVLWSIPFWFLFDMMTLATGLYARAMFHELKEPSLSFIFLSEKILPIGLKGLFMVGLLATIMSTLNSFIFISATTLGNDLFPGGKAAQKSNVRKIQWGLFVTGLFAMVMAAVIPSVVGLWYTIGSVAVPGMLLPLCTTYFPMWKLTSKTALATMIVGPCVTMICLAIGWSHGLGDSTHYPFGLEPMLPGLFVTVVLLIAGKALRLRGK